jgi:hypothetical protein
MRGDSGVRHWMLRSAFGWRRSTGSLRPPLQSGPVLAVPASRTVQPTHRRLRGRRDSLGRPRTRYGDWRPLGHRDLRLARRCPASGIGVGGSRSPEPCAGSGAAPRRLRPAGRLEAQSSDAARLLTGMGPGRTFARPCLPPECAMAWREVTIGETRWAVAPVAERVANTQGWRLVLSCRCAGEARRPFWAATGLQSSSRSDLYAQADRLSDARVAAVVASHVQPAAQAEVSS